MSTNAQNFGVSVSLDPNGHLRLTRFSRMRTLYVLLVAFECALRVLFVRVTTNDLFSGHMQIRVVPEFVSISISVRNR